MTDTTKLRELHAKATTPNEWGGPFDMQDATNKLLRALPTLLAKSDRADALEAELAGLTAQYEERTAYTIVHRGQALVCSDAMRGAYSDEHHRANRAEAELSALKARIEGLVARWYKTGDEAAKVASTVGDDLAEKIVKLVNDARDQCADELADRL